MSGELHLPDLPEVPVSLGKDPGAPCRPRLAWRARLGSLAGTALPLFTMAVLAAGTWWLVKNAPQAETGHLPGKVRHVPDYQVEHFTLERYDAQGRPTTRIEGEHSRHYPDTDEIEIDTVHALFYHPDGRVTRATAREALAAGDGSRVQLMGAAHVISTSTSGETVTMLGEELTAEPRLRRVSSDKPVSVRQGNTEVTADAFSYEQSSGLLTLKGHTRAVLMPRAASAAQR